MARLAKRLQEIAERLYYSNAIRAREIEEIAYEVDALEEQPQREKLGPARRTLEEGGGERDAAVADAAVLRGMLTRLLSESTVRDVVQRDGDCYLECVHGSQESRDEALALLGQQAREALDAYAKASIHYGGCSVCPDCVEWDQLTSAANAKRDAALRTTTAQAYVEGLEAEVRRLRELELRVEAAQNEMRRLGSITTGWCLAADLLGKALRGEGQ